MGEGPVIRRAVEADLDALMALRAEVAAEGRWIGAELPLDEEGDRAMLRRGIDGIDAAAFVAELDDRIVGNLGISLPRYLVADLGMLVAADQRGRGVGTALLRAGLDWAREAGAHKVALQVWPHNEPAIALYERHGFVREGHLRRHYPRKDGSLWDAVVMGLLLVDDDVGEG